MKIAPENATFYIGQKLPELKKFEFNPVPEKKTESRKDAIITIEKQRGIPEKGKALF